MEATGGFMSLASQRERGMPHNNGNYDNEVERCGHSRKSKAPPTKNKYLCMYDEVHMILRTKQEILHK